MTEESVKNPSDNATASKYMYYFINLYYVWQRKIIQYKDFRNKGTDSQKPKKTALYVKIAPIF